MVSMDNLFNEATRVSKSVHESNNKVVMISLDLIDKSDDNFYTVNDVQSLEDSIYLHGLTNPITLVPKDGGRFEVIAGHRRLTAYNNLYGKHQEEKYQSIPSIVRSDLTDIEKQLLLIETNSTARELSPQEKATQAKLLSEYYTSLKDQGVELTQGILKMIAEAMNTSVASAERFRLIGSNLIKEIDVESIPMSIAAEVARLPKQKQYVFKEFLDSNTEELSRAEYMEVIKAIKGTGSKPKLISKGISKRLEKYYKKLDDDSHTVQLSAIDEMITELNMLKEELAKEIDHETNELPESSNEYQDINNDWINME